MAKNIDSVVPVVHVLTPAADLVKQLRPIVNASCDLDGGESGTSCLNGTQMIPIHRSTLTAIVQHLDDYARLTAERKHPLATMVEIDEDLEKQHPGWMTEPHGTWPSRDVEHCVQKLDFVLAQDDWSLAEKGKFLVSWAHRYRDTIAEALDKLEIPQEGPAYDHRS